MSIDLGDPAPGLTMRVTDGSGALVNATTVVLTITLPDLTLALPPVVNGATGGYTATFLTTQAGRHTLRWVATGPNACTFSDTFNVSAADPGQLISLAEARAALGTQPNNTVRDEDLRSAICDATPIMEDLCGPLLRKTRVETYDGGRTQLVLLYSPLISVTSVVESYGSTYERALTLQNRFDSSPVSAYGFDVDLQTGLLTRLVSGVVAAFPRGRRNVQVTYVSGRMLIGGNILRATRLLVRQLWLISGQQGNRPQMGAPDTSVGTTPSGFAVPNAVIEMVGGADTRPPGIA